MQAAARGIRDRLELVRRLDAAKCIVDWWFSILRRGRKAVVAAVVIQCAWRCCVARFARGSKASWAKTRTDKSIAIQSWARSTPPRKKFLRNKKKAVVIQSLGRRIRDVNKVQSVREKKAEEERRRRSVIAIQSQSRRLSAVSERDRRVAARRAAAATAIQKTVRRFLAATVWANYGRSPFDCAVSISGVRARAKRAQRGAGLGLPNERAGGAGERANIRC
jgi:hypothetical protein